MVFAGANRTVYDEMWMEVPGKLSNGPTAVRTYMDPRNYPNVAGYANVLWPDVSHNGHTLVSIRPDITRLNNGDFDNDLMNFMASAPGGPISLLTMWHEAATLGVKDKNYPQEPDEFRRGQAHMAELVAESGSDVRFGMINLDGRTQDLYNTWMSPNLDWYGCDIYDNPDCSKDVFNSLDDFQAKMNALGGVSDADAAINVPECNSRRHLSTRPNCGSRRRADFFSLIWAWFAHAGQSGNMSGMLTFWGGPGGLSVPWDANDNVVVNELSAIFGASSP
jgi:hypothetical protein